MSINTADDYWDILNNFEDLLLGGYSRKHENFIPAPPSVSVRDEAGNNDLERISQAVHKCTSCILGGMRKNPVPGEGSPHPKLVVVGEAPGGNEDATGRPFVGAAGQYLDKWLKAIGLSRDENVFIGNIIKCRPPNNRDPHEEEIQSCFHFLDEQLTLLKPEAILCVGRFAGRKLSGRETSMNQMRGEVYSYNGIPVVVTYHPSAVLRNPDLRRPVWDDLQLISNVLSANKS